MTVRKLGGATIEKVEEICGAGFKPAACSPASTRRPSTPRRAGCCPTMSSRAPTASSARSIPGWSRRARHTILIDTCLGNHKQRHQSGLAQSRHAVPQPAQGLRLPARIGRLRDVHASACRSRRLEHQAGRRPLGADLPQCALSVRQAEYAHWESERGKQGEGKVNDGSFDDSVLPVVEAGKAVMIESDHQPDPLLTIKDYPGHTPGSIAINLKDGGRQACFSGDIMHHPIQVYHPDWSSQFCWDQEMSARSRRQLLEDCVESNALLCPAHFPGANAGYIKPQGDSFRIEWDNSTSIDGRGRDHAGICASGSGWP